jgi:hypothetical protein
MIRFAHDVLQSYHDVLHVSASGSFFVGGCVFTVEYRP